MTVDPDQLIRAISDHPWPGCQVHAWGQTITLMSDTISSMLLAAVLLGIGMVLLARKWRQVPSGGANVLELLVVFVRDRIAIPSLGERADAFMPFLLTLFVFVLSMNLFGLLPLESITALTGYPVGGTPTALPAVVGAFACLTLGLIIILGLRHAAVHLHERKGTPLWLAALLSPFIWFLGLSPRVPGVLGAVMLIPLALLEFVGVFAKCFSLMVRLLANMISGHVLLALILLFFVEALLTLVTHGGYQIGYVGPFTIAGAIVADLLELLVVLLQAYIFTFLTAIFIGLYSQPSH